MKIITHLFVALIIFSVTSFAQEDNGQDEGEVESVNANPPFVSNVFGSHMVLQRAPSKARIWGWSAPYSTVNLVLQNSGNPLQELTTTSDLKGFWLIEMEPVEASFTSYTVKVSSSSGDSALIDDVLFGDVVICGGQSNMQFTVSSAFNSSQEIAAANNYPNIRLFTVGQGTVSPTPLDYLATIEQNWIAASNTSVGGKDWSFFSATCWFYGRYVFEELLASSVPLGLISNCWGGTIIQAWSPPSVMSKCNSTYHTGSDFTASLYTDSDTDDPNQPSYLYNAMIVPYTSMAIKNAIWYQAEQNTDGFGYAAEYTCLFTNMVESWRELFNNKFPFLFVQLAPWNNANGGSDRYLLAEMRQAQFNSILPPNQGIGVATAADLGDAYSPYGIIHPRDKQTVSHRLTGVASALVYGKSDAVIYGPIFESASVLPSRRKSKRVISDIDMNTVSVRITFDKSTVGDGLQLRSQTCPPVSIVGLYECAGFEMSIDGNWFNASAAISSQGKTIDVYVNEKTLVLPFEEQSADEQHAYQMEALSHWKTFVNQVRSKHASSETVPLSSLVQVNTVRLGWADFPLLTVINSENLPAFPFSFQFSS